MALMETPIGNFGAPAIDFFGAWDAPYEFFA
jgi:hypothetical protein